VEDGVISQAEVIKAVVLRVAPRLAELDPDLFPEVDVVRMNGDKSTMRLLEVPGSGKAIVRPYEIYSFKIRAFVTHITQEGDLIRLAATRRQNGKRTVFIANAIHDSSPEEIVDFRDGILAALDNAAYKGVCTPKNSRLVAI
jgi:hypothetical protein